MPGFRKPGSAPQRHDKVADMTGMAPQSPCAIGSAPESSSSTQTYKHPQPPCARWILASCVRPLRSQKWLQAKVPRRTRVGVAIQRSDRCLSKTSAGSSCEDSLAFLFCAPLRAEAEDETSSNTSPLIRRPSGPMRSLQFLPPSLDLHGGLASLMTGLFAAAQQGLGSDPSVAMACMPIVVPFQVPMVDQEIWMLNKRACAFHRCCVIAVYAQGAFAVMKFARGNLVGGFYDAIQAAMGAYAIQPEGLRFFPTYLTINGFNGLLGTFKVLQVFNGVPLQDIPLMAIVPPLVALCSAYWGWEFSREIRAMAVGLPNFGPQDTCFVKCVGCEWRLPTALSSIISRQPNNRDADESAQGMPEGGYTSFSGSGRRLGECNTD